jgi:hypothetical protein
MSGMSAWWWGVVGNLVASALIVIPSLVVHAYAIRHSHRKIRDEIRADLRKAFGEQDP